MDTYEIATGLAFLCAMTDEPRLPNDNSRGCPREFTYVNGFETKAKRVSEKLSKEYEERKQSGEELTRRMFDKFYGDWSDRDIKRHWKRIPFEYQKEYCRRKGVDWVYSWSIA